VPILSYEPSWYLPYDGPTPYKTNFTGSVDSWTGQLATLVAGGVIHRQGTLCKAVQMAEAATNLVLNPSSEAAGNWGVLGAAAVTPNDATYSYLGAKASKVVTTAAVNDGCTATLSALANATHYASAWLYGTVSAATMKWSVDGITWTAPTLRGTENGWSLYGVSFPAAQCVGSTLLRMRQTDATARTWYVDCAQVEQRAYRTNYLDGSLGTGHAWTGAANASTSTRTAARLTYANPPALATGTIMAWVWFTDSNPAAPQFIAEAVGAAGWVQFYRTVTSTLAGMWGIGGLDSGVVVVSYAWHHVAMTYDGTTVLLYLDGVLVGSGLDAGYVGPTASMGIGFSPLVVGLQANARIDDAAVFGEVLTATEIETVYTAGAPLAPLTASLFPSTVGDEDACYFGCDTTVTDSGPFDSLVFDLLPPAAYGGDGTLHWQYWNGAWTDLGAAPDLIDDNTSMLTVPNTAAVSWHAPTDWITGTLNGVTAYWVRARFDTPGGAGTMTPPVQQHRSPYSVVWPCVDVVAGDVGGDVPLLARIQAECAHDDWAWSVMHVSARSLSRGEDFTPYLLAADEQNPAGVTVVPNAAGVGTFQTQVDTPPGRAVRFQNIPGATTDFVTFSLDSDLCPQWDGTYHAFARCWQSAGATSKVRLYLSTGTRDATATFTALWLGSFSAYLTPNLVTAGNHNLIDLGRITLPPGHPGMGYNLIDVRLNVQNTDAGNVTVWVSDLILMPVDEWSGTFYPTAAGVTEGYYADIDSVTNPRLPVHAAVRGVASENVIAPLQPIVNGAVQLQANAAQRLWFLFQGGNSPYRYAYDSTLAVVRLFGVSRYLGSRGGR